MMRSENIFPAEIEEHLHTILLVDDSAANLGVVVESLESHGYDVLVALDGEEALQRLEVAVPDLILLDVMMPGMDGFEVCRRLKAQDRTRDIPVIFMTSLSATEDKVQGFAVGGVDYITKPLQVEETRARIKTHLELRALRQKLEKQNEALQLEVAERKRAQESLREHVGIINELNDHLKMQAVELEASHELIKQTEAWYYGIIRSAPDGMVVADNLGNISLVNEHLEKLFGYAEGELIGQPMEMLLPPDVRKAHVVKRERFFASGAQRLPAMLNSLRACRKDGSEFPVEVSLSRLSDAGDVCAAIRDISERKRMEDTLVAREQELSTLLENVPDTIARYNPDVRCIYANPAFGMLVEGGVAALLGKMPTEYPGGPNADIYEKKVREVFETGVSTGFELSWTDRNGRNICSYIRLMAERDAADTVVSVLAVGRDITELNEHRKRVYQMEFYDTLTSLPNRVLFKDRLRQMLADASWHGQLAGVMIVGLDRFKAVNDSLGHPAGDALLREAAARLTYCVRGYDTVARLGGDEFAILLPEVRAGDDMGVVANKILESLKESFSLDGNDVFVTCSIGIAVYPADSEAGDELLMMADSAMYFAKHSGRNNFRFYSKNQTDISHEKLRLEGDLHHGFGRGELELYYQPKVCLSSGALIGSEALLRWNHPEQGLIPPDRFISIAEDNGMIVAIGEWVLRDACRVASEWNGHGKSLHQIAINLSARQFQSENLVNAVSKALEETGCHPEWIELEITESLLLDEDGVVMAMLEEFQKMGITIAIDDFGTGYSSLSYLARYPIDTLKIDRSFTSRVTEDGHHAELVKAIISIAHSLNQKVVAEGVETLEQADVLRAYGCHIAQGYLYSKPITKAAFAVLPQSFAQEAVDG